MDELRLEAIRTLTRLRRWRSRRPVLGPIVVAIVALALVQRVRSEQTAASEARRAWGRTVPVVVAERSVRRGTPVDRAGLVVRSLPAAVVPPHVLHAVPRSGTIAVDLDDGRVVSESDIGATTRALVTMPRSASAPGFDTGDRIRIITDDGSGTAHATAATVVSSDDATITVDVAPDEAPALALATSRRDRDVGFVLLGPSTTVCPS